MFASMLGFFLTFVILLFVMIGVFASLASLSRRDVFEVHEKSVLHLKLDREIIDREPRGPFESFHRMSFSPQRAIGLNNLLKNLEKAMADDHIEGIFLDLSFLNAGWATTDEIRKAIRDFQDAGKFVVSYGETYMQNAYYLGSVADEVYLHPEGLIAFRGINSELLFIKNMLDRLGIDPQLIRHGEYKSAGEPLFREDMSPENREQILSYTAAIWNNVMGDVGKSRGLGIDQVNQVADQLLTRNASLALESEMIDGIAHRDEILDVLRNKLGLEPENDIQLVSLAQYNRAPRPKSMETPRTRDRIAVIYGSGTIVQGSGSNRIIGSDRIAGAIREARKDETVKAIVFRINSPGGSALASDVILREVRLAAEEKPVIASMGDLAASGGYYIACAAHRILASPSTITGSIGVFGLIPNMQDFFNEKLGITFDNVKTNQFADLGSISRPMTPAERRIIEESIEEIYDTFINHVAEGRELPVSEVDKLGRGRVWSGAEARQNGLIDDFGGLQKAIEVAAELAELEVYRIREYPIRKDFFTQLMEDFGGISERMVEQKLGSSYRYYRQLEELRQMTGILTRLPYDIIME